MRIFKCLRESILAKGNKRTMQMRESAYEPICSLVNIIGEIDVYLKYRLGNETYQTFKDLGEEMRKI